MSIYRLAGDHELWPAILAHLERVRMTRWAVTEAGQPLEQVLYLGAVESRQIVGHISLRRQTLLLPDGTPIQLRDHPLEELFVETFAVDEDYRRQGLGTALQLAALRAAHDLGCYQLRSWSSFDHPENYLLKLRLGFAVHPAVYEAPDGVQFSGVYFAKTV